MHDPNIFVPFDFLIVTSRPKTEAIGYDTEPYEVDYDPMTQTPRNQGKVIIGRDPSYCWRERSTGIFNKDDDLQVDDW